MTLGPTRPPKHVSASAANAGAAARHDAAFRQEAIAGLRLAMWVRCAALLAIAVLIAVQNYQWGAGGVLYYEALVLVFGLLSVAQYKVAKARGGDLRLQALFILFDVALLCFTVLYPNPFGPFAPPYQILLRFENFMYFFILAAGVVLSYSPRLVLWVVIWSAATWTIASLPESKPMGFGLDPDDPAAFFAALLDVHSVNIGRWAAQVVIFLVFSGIMAGIVWRARRLVLVRAETERERANLARYFSPNLVDDLANSDEPLGAVRRQKVAVLFADIVGFTRMCERASPEEVIGLLRAFHGRMANVVFDHRGTLDKYIGDGVMATFGTPRAGPHDASAALACGRAMIASVAAWNTERAHRRAPPVRVAIGIHYGEVVLGDTGDEHRLEFAVVGDTVNVASRLERLARPLEAGLVVSQALIDAAQQEQALEAAKIVAGLEERVPQKIRGRDAPLAVWTLDAG
jgi:adenylate cyclase